MDETNEITRLSERLESIVNVDNIVCPSDTINPKPNDDNDNHLISSISSLSPTIICSSSSTSSSSPSISISPTTTNTNPSGVISNHQWSSSSSSPSSTTTTITTTTTTSLDSQESTKLTSNDKQPEMDCLLEKLRKGMTELSNQGDDFTKQMWNMYATFEDMISGSGQRDERSRSTLMELSSNSTLNTNHGSSNGKDGDNSKNCSTTSTSSIAKVSHPGDDSISSSSSPESELTESKTVKVNVTNLNKEISNSYQKTKESVVTRGTPVLVKSLLTNSENGIPNVSSEPNNEVNRRFRPIHLNSRSKLLAARQSNIDKQSTNLGGYQSDSGSNSSLANPLLDTISCLTSSDPYSDSDDYDVTRSKVIHQRARRRCRRMLSDRSIRCSPNHLHSCCSSDADSIGYAGSNSIDSGYKSLCPTPEVPESISNLLPFKTGDVSSAVSDKIQITAQSENPCLVMVSSNSSSSISAFQRFSCLNSICNSSNKLLYSDVLSQSTIVPSIKPRESRITTSNCGDSSLTNSTSSNSVSSLYSNKMVARLKNQSTEAQLEHLLTLRQSLISAIQKCESSTTTPTDSRVASPVISSRSTSPASTVIPRTVSNLKITPGLTSLSSSSSIGLTIQGANNTSNQPSSYQASSTITGSLSPSPSMAASSSGSTTLLSKSKRLPSTASPEPWYSQNHYSSLTSYHQNCHSLTQINGTGSTTNRYTSRVNNPPPQILHDHHQSIESVLPSSIISIDSSDRLTPTQLPTVTSHDVIGHQQQHCSSSSLTSLSSSSSFNNKSVRFEEVMITPFTNYQPATLNESLEIADYPIQPTERPDSLASSNTSSVAQVTVTSGYHNADSSGSSLSLNSNINVNIGITDNSSFINSNDNNNINNISNSNVNSSSIYNNGINSSVIGSSTSIKSLTGTFSTKSILKDPICANLRSSIESGKFNAAQSLENEIDSLLYGKHFNEPVALSTPQITSNESEFTSLTTLEESTNLYKQIEDDPLDIPYVKMIEEKYRSTNKVNKIKDHAVENFTSHTENANNHQADPMNLDEGINELANYQSKPSNYSYHKNINYSGSHLSLNHQQSYVKHQRALRGMPNDNSDSRLDSNSKSKISEMAKCMLGILDEIEMKNSIENRLPKLDNVRLREKSYTTRAKERPRPNSAEFRGSIELMPSLFINGETNSESSYHSLPEYHIYEEVSYDYMMDNYHRSSPKTVKEAPSSQPTYPRERPSSMRRMLPPNPSSSMSMLNNLRFTGKSGSSLYRSSLKDLLKPCDGNNNPRITTNGNTINEREVTLTGNTNGLLETELKCFRSSSSSPLSSVRTSSLMNNSSGESSWRSWGRATEQPKQRGNLYSLFTDPNQRVNISRSLRKEMIHGHQQSNFHQLELCNQIDGSSNSSEYGFKNN